MKKLSKDNLNDLSGGYIVYRHKWNGGYTDCVQWPNQRTTFCTVNDNKGNMLNANFYSWPS